MPFNSTSMSHWAFTLVWNSEAVVRLASPSVGSQLHEPTARGRRGRTVNSCFLERALLLPLFSSGLPPEEEKAEVSAWGFAEAAPNSRCRCGDQEARESLATQLPIGEELFYRGARGLSGSSC